MISPSFKISWEFLWRLALLILLIITVNLLATLAFEHIGFDVRPSNEQIVHRMIMASAMIYAGLIAIPFVPGVEVGLALIVAIFRTKHSIDVDQMSSLKG